MYEVSIFKTSHVSAYKLSPVAKYLLVGLLMQWYRVFVQIPIDFIEAPDLLQLSFSHNYK